MFQVIYQYRYINTGIVAAPGRDNICNSIVDVYHQLCLLLSVLYVYHH